VDSIENQEADKILSRESAKKIALLNGWEWDSSLSLNPIDERSRSPEVCCLGVQVCGFDSNGIHGKPMEMSGIRKEGRFEEISSAFAWTARKIMSRG
jgi:hypothetical protein